MAEDGGSGGDGGSGNGGLNALKERCDMMSYGQAMAHAYEKYDMGRLPSASQAMQELGKTARIVSDVSSSLVPSCLDEKGNLKGDLDDAQAHAMTMLTLSQLLSVEAYTAARLIAGEKARAAKA